MLKKIKMIMREKGYNKFKRYVYMLLVDAVFHAVIYTMLFLCLLDIVSQTFTLHKIISYTVIMIVCSILRYFILNKGYTGVQIEGANSIANLRIFMGDHIRNLPMGYFNVNNIGEITNIMTNDLRDFEKLITHMIPDIIKLGVLTVYLSFVLLSMSLKLGFIQVGILILGIPLSYYASKRIKVTGYQAKKVRSEMLSRIIEYTKGIQDFKSFGLVGEKFKHLYNAMKDLKRESIKLELAGVPFILPLQVLIGVSIPLMLYLVVGDLSSGQITAEQTVIFVVISLALSTVAKGFSLLYIEMRYYTLSIDKLLSVLETPQISYDKNDFRPLSYNIKFDDVSFSYIEGKAVLKNINFEANPGKMTALVGSSGSGKSTILNLIARFWDVEKGQITISGENINHIYPDRLLENISMVFQDVYLLHDTIYENIRMGNQNVTREEVLKAAKLTNCDEFVDLLEDGYDTVVHEGGSTLSGGEKQRISIARALVKNAPIVLFDEATASLDADNEFEIQNAIQQLIKDKTVLVIAHRLNTIQHADQIIVFDQGRIIESGSHKTLMDLGGVYCNMYTVMMESKEWKIA